MTSRAPAESLTRMHNQDAPHRQIRVTLPHVVRSEWIKFWSVRSTVMTLACAATVISVLGLLVSAAQAGTVEAPFRGGDAFTVTDPVSASLKAVDFAVMIIGVLGVLVMAREYSTGQIRTTLQAVPKRLGVLAAKMGVAGGVTLIVCLAALFVAFLGGQAIMQAGDVPYATLADSGALRAVIGSGLYLTGVAIIGVSLATLMRSVAGAIATIIALVMFIPALARVILPDSWDTALDFWVSNAADAFRTYAPDSSLSPGQGGVVFACWVVMFASVAALTLRLRDA